VALRAYTGRVGAWKKKTGARSLGKKERNQKGESQETNEKNYYHVVCWYNFEKRVKVSNLAMGKE